MWPGIRKLPKITSLHISLQCYKKQINEEVDFSLADKHQSMLQIDTMVLVGMVKHSQSFQESKFVMSLQYLKKEVKRKLSFCMQADFNILGIKVSYKVVLSLLMGRIKHSQSTQSNNFAISLQYLKKKLGMEFIFCM